MIDANGTHGEKSSQELHKNATRCLEKILDATTHKTATVQSPTFHLIKKSK